MKKRILLAVLIPLVLAGVWLALDWWIALPADESAHYVGRETCARCHANETEAWKGSDHDLAMDLATPEFVLGDFVLGDFLLGVSALSIRARVAWGGCWLG